MSKIAVIYKTNYGTTKKYAQWIAEELEARLIENNKIKAKDLAEYDTIIYGAPVFASSIDGVSLITQNYSEIRAKNIVVFSVGLTDTDDESEMKAMDIHNFTTEMLLHIKIFHLKGGMDYSKLKFVHKGIISMISKSIEKNENPTETDKMFANCKDKPIDFTDKDSIKPLCDYVKSITDKENINA